MGDALPRDCCGFLAVSIAGRENDDWALEFPCPAATQARQGRLGGLLLGEVISQPCRSERHRRPWPVPHRWLFVALVQCNRMEPHNYTRSKIEIIPSPHVARARCHPSGIQYLGFSAQIKPNGLLRFRTQRSPIPAVNQFTVLIPDIAEPIYSVW